MIRAVVFTICFAIFVVMVSIMLVVVDTGETPAPTEVKRVGVIIPSQPCTSVATDSPCTLELPVFTDLVDHPLTPELFNANPI